MTNMKKIILVCGFPGTGKTTLCNFLADKLSNTFFLDADQFYVQQGGKPTNFDELSEEEKTKLRETYINLKAKKIEELLEHHNTIIADGLFTHKNDRNFVQDLVLRKKLKLTILRTICPEKVVKERILSHKDHVVGPINRLKQYFRTKERWEEIEEDHFEINTNEEIKLREILGKINFEGNS